MWWSCLVNSLLHALVISLCTVDDYRVFLITPVVGRNDYINAVFASVSVALSRLNIMALVQHKVFQLQFTKFNMFEKKPTICFKYTLFFVSIGISMPILNVNWNIMSNNTQFPLFYQTYTEGNGFIITCSPLSHNVGDIWRLVHDHNVDAIVLMGSSGLPQVRSQWRDV